jgi:hypothetical protein
MSIPRGMLPILRDEVATLTKLAISLDKILGCILARVAQGGGSSAWSRLSGRVAGDSDTRIESQ